MVIPFFLQNCGAIAKSRIFNFFTALRTAPPPFKTAALKIGVAGFCWGGKYAALLAHDAASTRVSVNGQLQPLIDCAFTAHPSLLSMPGDIEKVQRPLSVAVGDQDMALSAKGLSLMRKILEGRVEHELVVLDGAKHGFAVRTDPTDELQNKYAVVAEKQAIEWFERWFKV